MVSTIYPRSYHVCNSDTWLVQTSSTIDLVSCTVSLVFLLLIDRVVAMISLTPHCNGYSEKWNWSVIKMRLILHVNGHEIC